MGCADSRLRATGVVTTNETEGRFVQWRPFSDATQDAVSSCAVSPQTRASEIPVPEPV